MEYIATAALISIAVCLVAIAWDVASATRALIEFIERPRNSLAITLSQADRDALVEAATKFRRNGPRVKKEAVNVQG